MTEPPAIVNSTPTSVLTFRHPSSPFRLCTSSSLGHKVGTKPHEHLLENLPGQLPEHGVPRFHIAADAKPDHVRDPLLGLDLVFNGQSPVVVSHADRSSGTRLIEIVGGVLDGEDWLVTGPTFSQHSLLSQKSTKQ